jgi:hypothetical protein
MFKNKPALARKWANENKGRNKGNSRKRNRRKKR